MIKLFFILLIFYPAIVFTQPVTQEWVRRYNEPSNMNDHSTSIALDKDGNIIVTGHCQTLTQSTNIVTVKYTPGGAQQWVTEFNYQSNLADEAHAMVTDTAGNIYITGLSGRFFPEIYDCVLLKYKTTGTLEWSRGYGNFTGAFYTNDLIIDRQGNIYVVGTTNVSSGNSVFLLKYNSSGDTIWTKRYKEPGYERNFGVSIAIDSINNVLIGGTCTVNSNSAGDCLIVKFSPLGNYLWSKTYNSGGLNTNDDIYRLGVDNSNNVYATGNGNYFSDYLTLKLDSFGTLQWFRYYNGYGNGSDYATSLAIDNGGNVYVSGASMGPTFNYDDYATIKYNSNGDSLWVRRYNGTGNGGGDAFDLDIDDSANVYVVGYGYGHISTVKYTAIGVQRWVKQYPGTLTQSYFGKRISVDSQRNIYVTGDNSDSATGSDYVTIKYSQLVGLTPITSETPQGFKLEQNYPNPFNPITKIKFSLPFPSKGGVMDVHLVIYDVLGIRSRS